MLSVCIIIILYNYNVLKLINDNKTYIDLEIDNIIIRGIDKNAA